MYMKSYGLGGWRNLFTFFMYFPGYPSASPSLTGPFTPHARPRESEVRLQKFKFNFTSEAAASSEVSFVIDRIAELLGFNMVR